MRGCALLTRPDETLVLQSQISHLRRPSQRALTAFKEWLNNPFPILGGRSKHFLDATDGLVALTAQRDSDSISNLLRRYWPPKEVRVPPSSKTPRKKAIN